MYLQNNTLLQGGKYKIINHISSGGFGNTYEGVHAMMDTRVAIKEFFPKMFCNRDEITSHVTVATQGNRELVEKLRKKFIKEARSIFKMNHPNIVKVHDIFEENGTAYYVMDFIEGESLGDIVKQRGALPESEAVGYIRQVADALKYVHSLNRLHLDIKPGNIMVDKNGKAILIDFGASKHYDDESGENTSTLMGVNTKGYAPIEQSTQSFTTFSPATDIYALGATLYKLLTGITPPDANLLMAEEDSLQPLPSSISSATRNAVMESIALRRKDRPQSVTSFISLLDTNCFENDGKAKSNEDTIINETLPVSHPKVVKSQEVNVTVEKEDIISKYHDFKPRKKWKRPFLPTLLFVIASSFAIVLFCYVCLETIDALSYEVVYDTVDNAAAEGETLYYARCEGYTGTVVAYSWERYPSSAQAVEDSITQYFNWYKKDCIFNLFLMSFVILVSYLCFRFCFPYKKHGRISDFADTIEKYSLFTGFKSKYKLYIKDGKYGIANVSRYIKVTEPVYDKITWKDKNSIYYGTINGETELYDVRYGELK